jgi:hypothetical protein
MPSVWQHSAPPTRKPAASLCVLPFVRTTSQPRAVSRAIASGSGARKRNAQLSGVTHATIQGARAPARAGQGPRQWTGTITGRLERPSQPPLETRKAAQAARAAYAAERGVVLMTLRAEALTRRDAALSGLAMTYQARAADLRTRLQGEELIAALAALQSEQKAAVRDLTTQLAIEARQRRRAVLQQLQARRKIKRRQLAEATGAAAGHKPATHRRSPSRRRRRAGKAPRLPRD